MAQPWVYEEPRKSRAQEFAGLLGGLMEKKQQMQREEDQQAIVYALKQAELAGMTRQEMKQFILSDPKLRQSIERSAPALLSGSGESQVEQDQRQQQDWRRSASQEVMGDPYGRSVVGVNALTNKMPSAAVSDEFAFKAGQSPEDYRRTLNVRGKIEESADNKGDNASLEKRATQKLTTEAPRASVVNRNNASAERSRRPPEPRSQKNQPVKNLALVALEKEGQKLNAELTRLAKQEQSLLVKLAGAKDNKARKLVESQLAQVRSFLRTAQQRADAHRARFAAARKAGVAPQATAPSSQTPTADPLGIL